MRCLMGRASGVVGGVGSVGGIGSVDGDLATRAALEQASAISFSDSALSAARLPSAIFWVGSQLSAACDKLWQLPLNCVLL